MSRGLGDVYKRQSHSSNWTAQVTIYRAEGNMKWWSGKEWGWVLFLSFSVSDLEEVRLKKRGFGGRRFWRRSHQKSKTWATTGATWQSLSTTNCPSPTKKSYVDHKTGKQHRLLWITPSSPVTSKNICLHIKVSKRRGEGNIQRALSFIHAEWMSFEDRMYSIHC